MNIVKIKSYAKVNLTLEVVGEENGYHLLDSLVANVDVFDLISLSKRNNVFSSVKMHGMDSESIPPENNNALIAAEAFSKTFGTNGADITIYKNIPIGAGLGGSSADIVGVLNGMAKLYDVKDKEELKALADKLGSDTGYMLTGGFARMQGRGEKVTSLPIKEKLHFLLLCPNSPVSAGGCYREYDRLYAEGKIDKTQKNSTEQCIAALLQNNVNEAGRYALNDLFIPSANLNPDVKTAYEEIQAFSPLCTVMTGSGSCVMGLFETKELCEWAKSRYHGKFRAYVVETVVPDYDGKNKKWRWSNPFALHKEETI